MVKNEKLDDVYMESLLTSKVEISINDIGENLISQLHNVIEQKNEGKCIVEGYIKPGSVKIINYSSGAVKGEFIVFHVVWNCLVCNPVEGMIIRCNTKTITKAGIHAEVIDKNGNVPITVFLARDHHFTHQDYNSITENSQIEVAIIGTRFELNDPYICAIAKLKNKSD